jgi:hypothetical protein
MTDQHDLHIEVWGDEIVVTLPGSFYSVAYYKSPKGSYLAAAFLRGGRHFRDVPTTDIGPIAA